MIFKLQSGGVVPPFADFTPIPSIFSNPFESEAAPAKGGNSSGKSNDLGLKDLFELVKKLEGLPNDSKYLADNLRNMIERASLFGDSLDSNDIAGMYTLFLSQMLTAKFSKTKYDEAFKKVNENGGLNEVAITSGNKLVAQDAKTGKISLVSLEEAKNLDGNKLILTNSNLLALRAKNPDLSFSDSVLDIVENGIGMETINSLIKDCIDKIGVSTTSNEGYVKQKALKFIEGLNFIANAKRQGADILGMTLEGLYKAKILSKDQSEQAVNALLYIYTMLPNNAKTLLLIKTGGTKEGVLNILKNLVGSQLSPETSFDVDLIENNKGVKPGSKESAERESSEKSNPYLQLIREEGGYSKPLSIITKSGNLGISVLGTWYGQIPKVNSDMSIDKLLSTGLQGIIENRDAITFGDLVIGSDLLKDVLYDNKGGTVATLPVKYDINGNKIVNLNIIDSYKKVQEKMKDLKNQNLSQDLMMKAWADIIKEELLDELIDPRTGLPNLNLFGEFLIVDAYTTDKIDFDTKSEYVLKVKNPDEQLEKKLIQGLSTDKDNSNYDIDVDDTFLFEFFWDDIYKANVYIPIVNNPNAAINAWGDQWKDDNVSGNEQMYLNFNKLKSMKSTSSEMI